MGRFARSQDATNSTGQTKRSGVIAVPGFSSKPEIKSKKTKSRPSIFIENRAKGMKYFWIVIISITGLSAGWVMGQTWINTSQVSTQVATITPSVYAGTSAKDEPPSEESAIPSNQASPSDADANFIEPDSQAFDYQDRRPGKAQRAITRAPRARAQEGPVTMALKPFKAINPLKLRKLRPW